MSRALRTALLSVILQERRDLLPQLLGCAPHTWPGPPPPCGAVIEDILITTGYRELMCLIIPGLSIRARGGWEFPGKQRGSAMAQAAVGASSPPTQTQPGTTQKHPLEQGEFPGLAEVGSGDKALEWQLDHREEVWSGLALPAPLSSLPKMQVKHSSPRRVRLLIRQQHLGYFKLNNC